MPTDLPPYMWQANQQVVQRQSQEQSIPNDLVPADSPTLVPVIDTQNLPNNMPKVVSTQPQFPGPYSPKSEEMKNYNIENTNFIVNLKKDPLQYSFIPGSILQSEDFKKINPAYATDDYKNYIKGIKLGENLIAGLEKNPIKMSLAQKIVNEAIANGANPRLVLSQVLHESSNFEKISNNNPAGVKISKATKQSLLEIVDPNIRQKVREQVTQIVPTRENLNKASIAQLQNMFDDKRFKFENNPPTGVDKNTGRVFVHGDIINKNKKITDELNKALQQSRENNDFSILKNKLKSLNALANKNASYWVTQSFMKYPSIEAGVADQIRAAKGGEDLSTWELTNNSFKRTMPNGKIIEYKYK